MPVISTIFAIAMCLVGLICVWLGGALAFGGATMLYAILKG